MTNKQIGFIMAIGAVIVLAAVAAYLGVDLETLLGAVEQTQEMTE